MNNENNKADNKAKLLLKRKVRTISLLLLTGIVLCTIMTVNDAWQTNGHNNVKECISGTVVTNKSKTISSGNKKNEKTAYLTFDDGPSALTPEILDILKEYDVKATFFMIGCQINKSTKKIVKRLCREGHQIGVHTYCHEADQIYCSADAYYDDVLKTEKIILKYTGETPLIYRFPWGSANGYIHKFKKDVIDKLSAAGLEYCDWNVSGEDSIGNPTASQIIANVKKDYDRYNEPVVLLHDAGARKETVKALPEIIKMFINAGYSFDIIGNRDKPYQWK